MKNTGLMSALSAFIFLAAGSIDIFTQLTDAQGNSKSPRSTASRVTPGDLDTTFGNGGILTDWSGYANGVAIQPDGKIVTAGSTNNDGSFALLRYNPDGSFDTDFGGGDGKVTTDIGFSNERANAVALQPNGKIVVVGTTWDGSASQWGHFSLVRYNIDGSLDLSFGGGDGIVITENLGTGWVAANAVVIQADGKIVVAGVSDYYAYDFPYLTIIRYNPNGSLDLPFGGGDGIATEGFFTSVEAATSVGIQPDGKIIAAGYSYGFWHFSAMVRLNSNGSLDATFGGGGIVYTDIGPGADIPRSVAIQSDGKIMTAGCSYNGSNNDFALIRYNPNGSLDTSFHGDGVVTTAIGSGDDSISSIVIQADGKIVAAGHSNNGSNEDFALARYNVGGSLDTTFGGGDGKIKVDFNSSNDRAFGMALDNVGRAVVIGESDQRFALARFLLDSAAAAVFVSGRVTTPSGLGLRNAVVTITDSLGVRRTATTSTFGFYSFSDVVANESYTFSVASRRYRFTPRTVTINDDLTEIDLIGLE